MFLDLNIRSLAIFFDHLQILNATLKEPPIALAENRLILSDPLDFYYLQGFQKT